MRSSCYDYFNAGSVRVDYYANWVTAPCRLCNSSKKVESGVFLGEVDVFGRNRELRFRAFLRDERSERERVFGTATICTGLGKTNGVGISKKQQKGVSWSQWKGR